MSEALRGRLLREVMKRRIAWKVDGDLPQTLREADEGPQQLQSSTVTLGPLQIRTFLVELVAKVPTYNLYV